MSKHNTSGQSNNNIGGRRSKANPENGKPSHKEFTKNASVRSHRNGQNVSVKGSPPPLDDVETLTHYVFDLIRRNPDIARRYLQDQMSLEVRQSISRQLVGGENLLTTCISTGANELLRYLITDCQLDVELEWMCEIQMDGVPGAVACSPLLKAICCRNRNATAILLEHGSDVNKSNVEGFTALHGACGLGDLDMVKLLVHSGADLFQHTTLGTTCLMNAKRSPEIRRYLLEEGADVCAVNVYGRSALHQSAMEGCLESSKVLLQYGTANIDLEDSTGITALFLAVHNGHRNIVKCLLDHGANPYIRNNENTDSFLAAIEAGHQDILDMLVEIHKQSRKKYARMDST